MLWCSLKLPRRGDSNVHPEHSFLGRIDKKQKASFDYHQISNCSSGFQHPSDLRKFILERNLTFVQHALEDSIGRKAFEDIS